MYLNKFLLSLGLQRVELVSQCLCIKIFFIFNNAIDCSPDGKYIAYGVGALIKIYNPKLRKQFGNDLVGHEYKIKVLKYSPHGKFLASACADPFKNGSDFGIRLWDPQTCTHLYTLEGHKWQMRSLSFSPDGLYLASGSLDETFRIWNMQTRCQVTLIQFNLCFASIDYSPKGRLVAFTGNKTIFILKDGNRIRQLHRHKEFIQHIYYSNNGQLLISGGFNSDISIWNVKSVYKLLRNVQTNHQLLEAMAVSRDSNYILSGNSYSEPTLWSLTSGTQVSLMNELQDQINVCLFSLDDKFIISATDLKRLQICPINI